MKIIISKNYVITAILYLKEKLEIKDKFVKLQEYSMFCNKLYEVFGVNDLDVIFYEEDLDDKYFYLDKNNMQINLNEPAFRNLEFAKNRYIGYIPFRALEIMYGEEALKIIYEIVIQRKKEQLANLQQEITLLESKHADNFKLERKK